jgi:hypothetical protein
MVTMELPFFVQFPLWLCMHCSHHHQGLLVQYGARTAYWVAGLTGSLAQSNCINAVTDTCNPAWRRSYKGQ